MTYNVHNVDKGYPLIYNPMHHSIVQTLICAHCVFDIWYAMEAITYIEKHITFALCLYCHVCHLLD